MTRCLSPSLLRCQEISRASAPLACSTDTFMSANGSGYDSDGANSVCGRAKRPPPPTAPPHPTSRNSPVLAPGSEHDDPHFSHVGHEIRIAIERLQLLKNNGEAAGGGSTDDLNDILRLCTSGYRKWLSSHNQHNGQMAMMREILNDSVAVALARRSQYVERVRVIACNRGTAASADIINRADTAVTSIRHSLATLLPTNPPPSSSHSKRSAGGKSTVGTRRRIKKTQTPPAAASTSQRMLTAVMNTG